MSERRTYCNMYALLLFPPYPKPHPPPGAIFDPIIVARLISRSKANIGQKIPRGSDFGASIVLTLIDRSCRELRLPPYASATISAQSTFVTNSSSNRYHSFFRISGRT